MSAPVLILVCMTKSIEPFATDEERTLVLTEILRQGGAVRGATLIGYVDRATHEVVAVRSIVTPDATLDDEACFSDAAIHELSGLLCEIAQDCVPARAGTPTRGSAITGDLITVVCRDGETAITPAETQFHWGWRYSNHLTSAFDGEVYAVTPQGWANLYGQMTGSAPALPPAPGVADPTSTVDEAENVLAELSSGLLGPRRGECLLCYVHRMIIEFGCDCRLRFATHYRDVRAPRATGLERRLGQVGGYCDCEIFLNGYELRPQYWVPETDDDVDEDDEPELTWPDPLPDCAGVRAGSTQPCSLWSRRLRLRWASW